MGNIKLLLYCCKDKRGYLHFDKREDTPRNRKYYLSPDSSPFGTYEPGNYLNGKILAECEFEAEEVKHYIHHEPPVDVGVAVLPDEDMDAYCTKTLSYFELLERTGLTLTGLEHVLEDYFGENDGYAIHIKNLKERVMELSDVYKYDHSYDNMFGWLVEENEKYIPLDKAPQNMCRVWIYENGKWVMYILISIRPEWMCLILNKDKTVEVRKRVLKEMIA